jgi:5-methylcytosine-specific restriction endonuclease McrA
MRRLANKWERDLLFILNDGKCAICGEDLPDHFDVDHIKQFARNGATELWNLQPLCKNCHFEKSREQAKSECSMRSPQDETSSI